MSLKKQYLKDNAVCRVTFRLSKKAAAGFRKVAVAGDFNQWRTAATIMKPLKNGDFTVTVDLPAGREHQYRFVADDRVWITDEEADKLADSGFADCRNSVVVT